METDTPLWNPWAESRGSSFCWGIFCLDAGESRDGWLGGSQRSPAREGATGLGSRLAHPQQAPRCGFCTPLLPGRAPRDRNGTSTAGPRGCSGAWSLRLPANSKRAAAGSSSGVQSSASFCSCFDDASACSHHCREAAALLTTTIY